MKQLDILFVNANSADNNYQSLSRTVAAREPNIWAGMQAQSCRMKGFSVAILDCEVHNYSFQESVNKINEHNPRVACFCVFGSNPNSSSQSMFGAIETAKLLKQQYPEYKILFFGNHVISLPKETLSESCIDMILTGEGVYALWNLLRVQNLNDYQQLKKVKGIGFKDELGQTHINEYERIVPKERLEFDLPGIAWDLLPDLKLYKTSPWHSWTNSSDVSPFASLYTSLGCFAKCKFCLINIINRTKAGENVSSEDSNIFRFWNPQFIIKQFDYLAEQNVKNIKIADEMFVLRKDHYVELCKLIKERGYKFNIWAYSRFSTFKEGYLDIMKEAGINWLALGIESVSETIRDNITKGMFPERDNISTAIQTFQKHDIAVVGNYIFGLTGDTYETIQETIDFMMNNLTENMNIYPAMAYPGSPLYLEAKNKGYDLPKTYSEWAMFSYDTKNLPSDYLSAAEILRLRDKTWFQYFTNPKYLEWMKGKYGQKCYDSIIEMTKPKLRRKLLGDAPP